MKPEHKILHLKTFDSTKEWEQFMRFDSLLERFPPFF